MLSAGFVAQDHARAEAVRRWSSSTLLSPLENRPPEMNVALFLEVVIAAAGGDGELGRSRSSPRRTPRSARCRRAGRHCRASWAGSRWPRAAEVPAPKRGVGEGVIARGRQALAIEAVGVASRSRRPRHCNGPSRRSSQPDLLGEGLEIGGVDQVGGQQHARGREAEIDRDAAGQRAGVAADEDVAVDVGRDRGQRRPSPKSKLAVRSASKVSSAKALVEQQELLALVEGDARAASS